MPRRGPVKKGPQKQKKGSLADRPAISSVAAAAGGGGGGGAKNQPLGFLTQKKGPARATLQIDDPKLVKELRAAEHDALVSEVVVALNDRSLPLHMRDTAAALLRGFRSQDAAAREVALEIAAKVATSANSQIGELGVALNSRLDVFIEAFREAAGAAGAAGAAAWGGAAAAGATAVTMDAVDEYLFRALNTFSATIQARQAKFASTTTAEGAEYTLDTDALGRFVAGTLLAPSDAARRAAGEALCIAVTGYLQNDPAGTMRPQVLAWAKETCTAAVDGVADSGAAPGGGALEYAVVFFARALGSAFVFRDCGLSAVLHHAREHFGQSGFPTRRFMSLLTLLPGVGGRSTVPFVTNPERFLSLDIIVDLCGRGAEMRTLALAAARELVAKLHLVDLDETMRYLLNIAASTSTAWKQQMAALNIIVEVATSSPENMEHQLHRSMSAVMDLTTNSKRQVAEAAADCLRALTDVVTNPETVQLRPFIIDAILDNSKMQACLDAIMEKTFVNSLDIPSLSVIFPALYRAMRSSKGQLVEKACTAITNVTALVTELEDLAPFRAELLDELSKQKDHSWPEVRDAAEKAMSVIRAAAAQGASEEALQKEQAQFEADVRKIGENFIAELQAWEAAHEGVQMPLSVKKYFARVVAGVPGTYSRSEIKTSLTAAAVDIVREYGVGERDLVAMLTRASAHMKRRNASSRQSYKAKFIVRCKNIILAFASKVLLQRTNLELRQGVRYAIVGQNGVGKTTLLNRVAAKDINGFPQHINCYFVRHEIAASAGTSVRQFMALPVDPKDQPGVTFKGSFSEEAIHDCLAATGFLAAKMENYNVDELSGGWKMKLAIAKSILVKPELLLLDEPTNHLDVAGVEWLAGYLNTLEITIAIVSHDYDFLQKVSTGVIHLSNRKLSFYDMGFSEFQAFRPDVCAALPKLHGKDNGGGAENLLEKLTRLNDEAMAADEAALAAAMAGGGSRGAAADKVAADKAAKAAASVEVIGPAGSQLDEQNAIVPIKFPNPGLLDGAKGKYAQVVKLTDLTFWYPGAEEKTILKNVSGYVSLKSRIAILGKNGAGKSTLMQLLIGELELPDAAADAPLEDRGKNKFGSVYRHHNLRVAYIAQHSMHHLEDNLEDTAIAYLMTRFRFGMDRELAKVASVSLTPEEVVRSQKGGEVCAVVARFLRAKELIYELEVTDYRTTVKKSLQQISFMPPHVMKLCRNFDERMKAEQSGMALRAVTSKEILLHLKDFGISAELARRKLRWLSAGQRCRLVLAAASWNRPHMIAVDEPTNYLDNETLAALTAALRSFQGAVITITHNEGFVKALCNELWHVKTGELTIQKLKEVQTVGPSVEQIARRRLREAEAEKALLAKAKQEKVETRRERHTRWKSIEEVQIPRLEAEFLTKVGPAGKQRRKAIRTQIEQMRALVAKERAEELPPTAEEIAAEQALEAAEAEKEKEAAAAAAVAASDRAAELAEQKRIAEERAAEKAAALQAVKDHNKKINKELKVLGAKWNELVGERHARERGKVEKEMKKLKKQLKADPTGKAGKGKKAKGGGSKKKK